jgi:UDP-N-acetylmuramate: L-alanyl-gamma-D-glutamyl-meso-diaminopimelate ligase
MHIHILGICGTFMGGIAQLASALGHKVTGSDANVYPPMSTQLEQAGIALTEGWDPAQLDPEPDVVVVGNALSRGNPVVEAVLDRGLRYTSGPQWLAEHVLHGRWVLGVAGTHGKTTTASMLAWILEHAGLAPGFLIGGVPKNFDVSARNGGGSFFVVEADEYDTAFFDKRSKFVHYHPRTLVMNNLEYDHADIFEDLEAIQRQFHHLVRTVPGSGLIVMPLNEGNLHEVLDMGCWTPVEYFDPFIEASWHALPQQADNSVFDVVCEGKVAGRVDWPHTGRHNLANALAALAAARHAGVPPAAGVAALNAFSGVKRRMELRGEVNGIAVYDDFAHHPTAIGSTLAGLRAKVGEGRILAVLEPRSNTMRLGVHAKELPVALDIADQVFLYDAGDLGWEPARVLGSLSGKLGLFGDIGDLVATLVTVARPGDTIIVMSNGGFGGIHQKLLDALQAGAAA